MKRKQIEVAIEKAWKLASKYNDGHIVLQLKQHNRSIIISHQFGNSWESMGLNAQESQDRILEMYPCGEEYNIEKVLH